MLHDFARRRNWNNDIWKRIRIKCKFELTVLDLIVSNRKARSHKLKKLLPNSPCPIDVYGVIHTNFESRQQIVCEFWCEQTLKADSHQTKTAPE